VIAEPLLAGMSNVIVACPFHLVAMIFVGILGMVAGVTALLVEELTLVPTAFVAVTVKV